MTDRNKTQVDGFESLADVPTQVINTYARLWQLETWLRTMVYVELRALLADDWGRDLTATSGPLQADKALTHMPTPELNALSYSQLSKLITLVDAHWNCFAIYLPPKSIWTAKMQEIVQIRHRVAHFRVGHADDLLRVKQFLRDIDLGFWRFCTSYNDATQLLPQSSDPITAHFLPLDPLPWVEFEERKWAQIGVRDNGLPVGLSVRAQRRPWASKPVKPGEPGHLYNFYMFAQDGRGFEMKRLLEKTQPLHKHLVHLCLDSDVASIRFTLPSLLGSDAIITIVEAFHAAAINAVRRVRDTLDPEGMNALAAAWPEYVLGPKNPLTFLGPDMDCSFFDV
ncbi:hypothetical protein FHS82_004125 [Pseudochelatococcus lubricantis]|uniref:Swt1-like HEPN domain-containing protein n=1 Tax=Pseudochelatococcus lubricantis TaxID=1538102 RepID=A0ABX0V7E9_9HYPH|nr:hypothetical protein [Pseudochelatococcus lubricantis]NIJ60255.1 hypothetical protein [Pseudochelatococcus lubricantis]